MNYDNNINGNELLCSDYACINVNGIVNEGVNRPIICSGINSCQNMNVNITNGSSHLSCEGLSLCVNSTVYLTGLGSATITCSAGWLCDATSYNNIPSNSILQLFYIYT